MANQAELPGLGRSAVNVLASWGTQLASVFFSFLVVPLVTRRFGVEGLGVWLLVQQTSAHLQLFEVGLNTSLGRFLARDLGRGDKHSHDVFLSSAVFMLSLLCLVVIGLTVVVGRWFPSLFNIAATYVDTVRWMIVVAGISTAVSLPLRVGVGVLASRHRFDVLGKWELLAVMLKAGLVILVCFSDTPDGLVFLSLAVFGPALVGAAITFMVALRSPPASKVGFGLVSLEATRALLGVSASALLITAAAVVLRQGSPMLVGKQFGVEAIPLLAIPMMIVTSLGPFVGVANRLIAPVASQLDSAGQYERLLTAFKIASQYTLSVGIFLLCVFVSVGQNLIDVWLGTGKFSSLQLSQININIIIILSGYCLTVPVLLGRAVLASIGFHWGAAVSEVVSITVGLIVGAVLMYGFRTAVWGMAVGVAIAYLVRALSGSGYALAEYFGTSRKRLLISVWLWPVLIGLLAQLFMGATIYAFGGSVAARVVAIAGGAILWAWLSLAFVVIPSHRERLVHGLSRCWNR